MRHHSTLKKFGRIRKTRTAFMRGLAKDLLTHERITTTVARAKAIKPVVEKLITNAKKDTVGARRITASRLGNDSVLVKKLHEDIAKRYEKRNGGYIRITKLATISKHENAFIELV